MTSQPLDRRDFDSWFASFFDGDGCISMEICKRSSNTLGYEIVPMIQTDSADIRLEAAVKRSARHPISLRWPGQISTVLVFVWPCMECDGIGGMPSPNHTGWRTNGGSHGDDMDSDGVVRGSSAPSSSRKSPIFERPQWPGHSPL